MEGDPVHDAERAEGWQHHYLHLGGAIFTEGHSDRTDADTPAGMGACHGHVECKLCWIQVSGILLDKVELCVFMFTPA